MSPLEIVYFRSTQASQTEMCCKLLPFLGGRNFLIVLFDRKHAIDFFQIINDTTN